MKRAVLCVFTVLAFGCGDDNPGNNSMTPDGGGNPDSMDVDAADNGMGSSTYPAFPIDTAVVVTSGGPVDSAMIIVTVTWSSDPNVAIYQAFGDAVGASNYWRLINSEYGVGPTTSGSANHVNITTAPPSSISDTQIRNLIISGINGGTYPAPTTQTLYAVYIPPGTTTSGGCTSFDGYHSESSANGVGFSYAVIAPCNGSGNEVITASHEFDEAATDPFPRSNPAWAGFDSDHNAFELFMQEQDELGDACEFSATNYFSDHEAGLMYDVQRQWSNANARAGHNPCVPSPPTPFYGTTILPGQLDTVSVNLRSVGILGTQTKGFKVAVGQSRTFQVGYFSDRATTGPWTLSASVPALLPGSTTVANGTATVTIDKTSGLNGEKANITITPQTFNSGGGVYVELVSHLPNYEPHYTPFLIGAN